MSLETGALKVGWGPQDLAKRYRWQPCKWEPLLHAAANWHHHTEGISGKYSSDPILTNTQTQNGEGGAGCQNLQRVALMPEQHQICNDKL